MNFIFELVRWHLDEYDHSNSKCVQLTCTCDIFRNEFSVSFPFIQMLIISLFEDDALRFFAHRLGVRPSCGDNSSISFSFVDDCTTYLTSEIRNDFSSCRILLNLRFWCTINSLVGVIFRIVLSHR